MDALREIRPNIKDSTKKSPPLLYCYRLACVVPSQWALLFLKESSFCDTAAVYILLVWEKSDQRKILSRLFSIKGGKLLRIKPDTSYTSMKYRSFLNSHTSFLAVVEFFLIRVCAWNSIFSVQYEAFIRAKKNLRKANIWQQVNRRGSPGWLHQR